MRRSLLLLICIIGISCSGAMAGDRMPTVAVFTKKNTNPAYAAFRIAL